MKIKLFLTIIFFSLFSLKAFAFAKTPAPAPQDSDAIIPQSMKAMEGMSNFVVTGNQDVDFFTAMIPHHEGAIVMSEMMKENISEPTLKKLANSIIESQKAEIIFMKTWLSENPASPEDKLNMANSEKMQLETARAMDGMHMAKMTGDANKDFVLGMVPHHKAAVKMAEAVLPYLKDQQTIKFANDVVEVQSREIKQMETWLEQAK